MSREEKIIIKCDNCEKELEESEKYYYGNLIETFTGCNLGKQVLSDGDYCEKCFKKIILNELNFKATR